MIVGTLLALVAVLALVLQPAPLSMVTVSFVTLPLLLAGWYWRRWRAVLWLPALMLVSATVHFHWRTQLKLPEQWLQATVQLQGVIASVPEQFERGQRFFFDVEKVNQQELSWPQQFRLRLSHYAPEIQLRAGQRWQFQAKLKPAHGTLNFHGFDYERWLFAHHVVGSGYVQLEHSQLLAANPWSLNRWRETLSSKLSTMQFSHQGLIEGITIGLDEAIPPSRWDVYRDTGTIHLVVISGMHLTLVAMLIGLVVGRCWRFSARLCLWLPAPRVALIAGFVGALFYAGIAGFSIATVRSLWMLFVVVAALLLHKRLALFDIVALAVLAMLFVDPCAVLESGLWLSFTAVVVLLALARGRLHRQRWWWQAITLQFALSLAMLPLTVWQFGSASLISPLSNLLAVPWVSFVSTPLALLGMLLLSFSETLAWPFLALANLSLQWFDLAMDLFMQLPQARWQPALHNPWIWLLPALTVVLWLMPWTPWRRLTALLLLPFALLLWRTPIPPSTLQVFDVGQGTALAIHGGENLLVYDTGPRSEKFDSGTQVVAPHLRALGFTGIDLLMVSHADLDHAGGLPGLLQQMPVRRVLLGEAIDGIAAEPCRAGQRFQLGEIQIEVLYPFTSEQGNAASCVLRVQLSGISILLTGDISRREEARLLARNIDLSADVLLVPHHGSNGSSSVEFLAAVSPKLSIVSAGYRNAHRHPRPEVLERLSAVGSQTLNTAVQGALRIELTDDQYRIEAARNTPRIWRSRVEPPGGL